MADSDAVPLLSKAKNEIVEALHTEQMRFSTGKISRDNLDRRAGYCQGLTDAVGIISKCLNIYVKGVDDE
jgi:hypothetical protein